MRSDVKSATLHIPPRHGRLREFLGVHPALIAGGLAMLAVPQVANTYWTFNVEVGLVMAISCLGLLVLVGWAREISLTQAALTYSALHMSQYAYTNAEVGYGRGYAFPVAAAWGIGFVVAVSFLIGLVCMRLAGPYVVVLTLAVQFWLENSIMIDDTLSGGLCACSIPRPNFFGLNFRSDGRFYYLIFGCLLVVVVFLHRARHSRFGRSMILVGSDPEAAACVGVSPWRYRVWAFVVAGALAGLAGALSGPLFFSPPGTLSYISFSSMAYLAVPVLAGFDSITGTVAVAVALTLVPQIERSWELNVYVLAGVAMTIGVLLGPRGLAGVIADRFGGPRAN
jgi:branched-chain amino acid transport system permease protein